MCSRIKNQEKKRVFLTGRKKSGLNNLWWKQFNIFKKHIPTKKAIHVHVGMEHNLARYAKYYSCGST
jgi:hypothetical protein